MFGRKAFRMLRPATHRRQNQKLFPVVTQRNQPYASTRQLIAIGATLRGNLLLDAGRQLLLLTADILALDAFVLPDNGAPKYFLDLL